MEYQDNELKLLEQMKELWKRDKKTMFPVNKLPSRIYSELYNGLPFGKQLRDTLRSLDAAHRRKQKKFYFVCHTKYGIYSDLVITYFLAHATKIIKAKIVEHYPAIHNIKLLNAGIKQKQIELYITEK